MIMTVLGIGRTITVAQGIRIPWRPLQHVIRSVTNTTNTHTTNVSNDTHTTQKKTNHANRVANLMPEGGYS